MPAEAVRGAFRDPRGSYARWAISRLVAANLDDIRRAAEAAQAQVDRLAPPRVYVFWAQSIENAPEVIRLCWRQLRRVHDPQEIVALDLPTTRDLIDIPPDVLRKTETDMPMLADIVRLELLWRYGGVWADASCLALDNLVDESRHRLQSGFFAFTRQDRPLASWFLASEPGDYVVGLWRQAMHAYWRHFDRKIHYFVIHHLFEALCRHDAEFRRRWAATPRVSAEAPHLFQRAMHEPYDAVRYRELLGGCFVHKLTYKVTPDAARDATLLGHLLREGPDPALATGGAQAGALNDLGGHGGG